MTHSLVLTRLVDTWLAVDASRVVGIDLPPDGRLVEIHLASALRLHAARQPRRLRLEGPDGPRELVVGDVVQAVEVARDELVPLPELLRPLSWAIGLYRGRQTAWILDVDALTRAPQ